MEMRGMGVCSGIAIGTAFVVRPLPAEGLCQKRAKGDAAGELARFAEAKLAAAAELRAVAAAMAAQPEQAKIFEAQQQILEDEEIFEMVSETVNEREASAEAAVQDAFDAYIRILSKSKNQRIRERADDLLDVCKRLLRILAGAQAQDLSHLPKPVILVAHDLLPGDTATLDRAKVLAIVCETGGVTSHTAILAKSYGIPTVLGVTDALMQIRDGDTLVVDADAGTVLPRPSDADAASCGAKQAAAAASLADAVSFQKRPCRLKSGERIEIGLNIGSPADADAADACDFVGLFRSEFLYMHAERLPDEQTQFAAYKQVLERMGGRPVTLRTLDIGGDKTLPYLELPKEANPFLGRRALRLCFDEPALFRSHLRAAYRASAFGTLRIMFPMVGSMDDWYGAKSAAQAVREELQSEGVPFDRGLQLGVMIEIPSLALLSDLIAAEADFASIGTNDLCQYLCAADRMEPGVAPYYQSFSPACLRILGQIITAFRQAGKDISVCGELAGDPQASAFLAGLGLRKFSMSAACIGAVKRELANVDLTEAEALAAALQKLPTQQAVLERIRQARAASLTR